MDFEKEDNKSSYPGINRRNFIKLFTALGALAGSGYFLLRQWNKYVLNKIAETDSSVSTPVFIAKVKSYSEDIRSRLLSGFKELGINEYHIKNKRILLKPNYIETLSGSNHINTHYSVIGAAIDAFYSLGAASVIVAEASGNCRDTIMVMEDTGLIDVLRTYNVSFVDLNYSDCFTAENMGKFSGLPVFVLPNELRQVDMVVSMAKMKTHHWAGITASMKNMFGVMPGSFYGWPKNVLHYAGIENCILDIISTARPHFSIVDGIIGMEGDGPIMGTPKSSGVLVMGHNLPSVDATCARIMDVNPDKIGYLSMAKSIIGPTGEKYIFQRGENIRDVKTPFHILDHIPALAKLREVG